MVLTGRASWPWQLKTAHISTLNDYCGYVYTSRSETAKEFRARTGSAAEPVRGGPPRTYRLVTGFAEHDEIRLLSGLAGSGRHSAPQDTVLGHDVHELAVEPDPGPLPGQREPTWMTWLPSVMIPAALTSRCTSTQLLAVSGQGAGPAGAGPAGQTPVLRNLARSTADTLGRAGRPPFADAARPQPARWGSKAAAL